MQKLTDVQVQEIVRKNHLVDAEGKILGRLAQEVAGLLRGKGNGLAQAERDEKAQDRRLALPRA